MNLRTLPMGQKKPDLANETTQGHQAGIVPNAPHTRRHAGQDGIAHMGKVKRLPCSCVREWGANNIRPDGSASCD